MSTILKQLPNCLKKSRNKHRSNRFYGVLCDIHTYTVAVTQHESGTRNNYIFVSDHIKQKLIQLMQFECSNRISAG